jgi:hypothetical protein
MAMSKSLWAIMTSNSTGASTSQRMTLAGIASFPSPTSATFGSSG